MKSILILDDDADLAEMLELTMKHLGAPLCKVVHSYKELIDLPVELSAFDVALLDINLGPDQPDGIEAYKYLKGKKFPGQVIFFTGHGKSDPRIQAITNFSLTGFLEKPVPLEILSEIIK